MGTIVLRPLRHGERRPVLEVFAGLSEASRRLRFLGAKPELSRRELELLVDVGRRGREAVAAVEAESGRTVGIARFVRDDGAPEAEVAFAVVDDAQGRGIGRRLVTELRTLAREQGILRLRATVDRSNRPALALVRSLGDVVAERPDGPAVELVVRLP
ncbi:MAG TPA: GNAT family N-acetyltransferase [Gaiellaceae bacterium]|nr:GNAT family N-acetyltransferase [Gaiellaceae bacterium]